MAGVVRRAAKIDANQPDIVAHLRANDWGVWVASAVGQGFPDLVCARLGFTALAEVKDGSKLTPPQEAFHKTWPGTTVVVYSPADALAKLNAALVRSGFAKLEDLKGAP